ncbi:hypothetical protein SAMN02745135_02355 [Caloranaerobacter azorensis DSM 13643]|uniref:Uncharacterized protein n=1 Tax=Caloranaerobacter azorensis DSM 13643 TaxID=1121264 RepID=A0A1M5W997_9FIRM|nr:hypothetical protein [Caloranaerobacter azorensis]SHH84008.1 hypothetical protein SAMN02745135_02355 [Caloranaerobacter azorensis DSM 13643]
MIKIGHKREVENIKDLPKEVLGVIREIAATLDTYYGENRDVDNEDGGYVLIIESEEDIEKLEEFDIYLDEEIYPEYVDRIKVEEGEDWINVLILCNNEFGISLIMPISIAPETLLYEISEEA